MAVKTAVKFVEGAKIAGLLNWLADFKLTVEVQNSNLKIFKNLDQI